MSKTTDHFVTVLVWQSTADDNVWCNRTPYSMFGTSGGRDIYSCRGWF